MKRRTIALSCAVVVFVIALVTVCVAFATSNWIVSDYRTTDGVKFNRLGLWTHCFGSLPDVNDDYQKRLFVECIYVFDSLTKEYDEIRGFSIPGFMIATQFFYTLCLIGIVISLCLVLLFFLCGGPDQKRFILIFKLFGYILLVTGISGSIGVIIFACFGNKDKWMSGHANNFFGYSFGLGVVGAATAIISSALFLTEAFQAEMQKQWKESQTRFERKN